MTRTIGASDAAMLATREHTRATCIWIVLRDGQSLGLTNHDKALTVDMADISDTPIVFRPDQGIMISDITLTIGTEANTGEITGPIGGLMSIPNILGKRFDRARIRIFDVDWTNSWPTVIPIMGGKINDTKIRGGEFVFEIRDWADNLNSTIGRVMTPYCPYDFGDSFCTKSDPAIAATISAVVDEFRFTLDLAGVYSDNYFNYGTVEFQSGDLFGLEKMEIIAYDGATSALELLAPLAAVPDIGDSLLVRRGCSKIRMADDASVQTCLFYENVINFGGYPDVKGSDMYLKIAIPGQQGA